MKVSRLNCLFGIFLVGMISLIIACNAGVNQGADMTGDSIQKVQVKTLLKTTQSWNGSPLPDYESERPEITALSITIPPNTKLPVHRHPVINAGMLLRGELTVISEAGDTLQIKAGELDLAQAQSTGISGLNTYYRLEKIGQYPYARLSDLSDWAPPNLEGQ